MICAYTYSIHQVQENYEEITTSEKGHSNGFEISSFGIEVKSKQISTWDYVIPKMEIRDDSSKDVCL